MEGKKTQVNYHYCAFVALMNHEGWDDIRRWVLCLLWVLERKMG